VSYQPKFAITPALLGRVEQIAALRERILTATVEVPWIAALQKDTRTRNTHSSTAIEGNPLTLEQVRAVEEGREVPAVAARARREVVNYFAGLRCVEKHAVKNPVSHEAVLSLHKIIAGEVMDQGTAGRYRTIAVRVGRYVPPPPEDVSGLMFELLTWWNQDSAKLSPVLSSAIVHYRFEAIHPFADGNGRTGRALALWELYRRGFLLGEPPALLRGIGCHEASGRGFDRLARIRRRGFATDVGACLDAGAEIFRRFQTAKTGVAPQAGATPATVAGSQEHDTTGNLGRAGRDEAGRNQADSTAAGCKVGAARRHAKIGPLYSDLTPKTFSESFSKIFSKWVGNSSSGNAQVACIGGHHDESRIDSWACRNRGLAHGPLSIPDESA
jgi:fido (protein-threonine AMPylation protein)